jgi:hypothetical protein
MKTIFYNSDKTCKVDQSLKLVLQEESIFDFTHPPANELKLIYFLLVTMTINNSDKTTFI